VVVWFLFPEMEVQTHQWRWDVVLMEGKKLRFLILFNLALLSHFLRIWGAGRKYGGAGRKSLPTLIFSLPRGSKFHPRFKPFFLHLRNFNKHLTNLKIPNLFYGLSFKLPNYEMLQIELYTLKR